MIKYIIGMSLGENKAPYMHVGDGGGDEKCGRFLVGLNKSKPDEYACLPPRFDITLKNLSLEVYFFIIFKNLYF